MKLFAQLRLIVLWDMLLLLNLPNPMCERALQELVLYSENSNDGGMIIMLTLSLNSQ